MLMASSGPQVTDVELCPVPGAVAGAERKAAT